jgi:hypothetical protein
MDAAGRMAHARRRSSEAVRPTFVLALEEQLRAGLRVLHGPAAASGRFSSLGRRAAAWLLGSVACAVLLLAGARGSAPGEPLYGLRRGMEDLGTALVLAPEQRSARDLELGWQRLEETRALLATERYDPDLLARMLADLAASYAGALSGSAEVADPRAAARARTEVAMALHQLAQMDATTVRERRQLERTREYLAAHLAQAIEPAPGADRVRTPSPTATVAAPGARVVPSASPSLPPPTAPALIPTATAAAAPSEPTLPPVAPTDTAWTPTPSSTPWPPTAVPTEPAPSATRPNRERPPSATPTALPPPPTSSPQPFVSPSPSPDAWPTPARDPGAAPSASPEMPSTPPVPLTPAPPIVPEPPDPSWRG